MKFSAKILPILLLGLFVFTTGLIVVIRKNDYPTFSPGTERTLPDQLLNEKVQRPLDDSKYSQKGFIVPLESNAKGSIYSSRAQIRGIVDTWKPDRVRIKIGDETKDIALPGAVYLYCAPKYFTDSAGKQVPSATVWMDIKNPERLGTLMPSTGLSKIIPNGSDITVLVNVGEEDSFTAYFVGGYGCTVK